VLSLAGDRDEGVLSVDKRLDEARRAVLHIGTIEMAVYRDGIGSDLVDDAFVPLAEHLDIFPLADRIHCLAEAIVAVLVHRRAGNSAYLKDLAGMARDVLGDIFAGQPSYVGLRLVDGNNLIR